VIPASSLLLALLAGGFAGWFLRGWLAARRVTPSRPAPSPTPAPPPEPVPVARAEPEEKMEAVLTELERRYQGRKADAEPGRPKAPRKRSGKP